MASQPRCIIIAGPNGAGKTIFAREFLPRQTDTVQFVNADLIADGLSALRRFQRSWINFERIYRPLADRWSVYDNSGPDPLLVERGP